MPDWPPLAGAPVLREPLRQAPAPVRPRARPADVEDFRAGHPRRRKHSRVEVGVLDSSCQRTYRDKAEANRALKERTAQEVRDELPDEAAARQPFEEVALARLGVTRRKVEPRTAEGYASLLRTHVLPAFGDRRIGTIRSQGRTGCTSTRPTDDDTAWREQFRATREAERDRRVVPVRRQAESA